MKHAIILLVVNVSISLVSMPSAAFGQLDEWREISALFDAYKASADSLEKTKLIEQIVERSCRGSDRANVRTGMMSKLQNIPHRYFSPASKRVIREALNDDGLVTTAMVFMIGYLDIREEQARLEELAEREPTTRLPYYSLPWAAQLTLGRFGDRARSEAIIKAFRAERDILLKASSLIEHLIYLNSIEAMAPLIEMLYDDRGYSGDLMFYDAAGNFLGFDQIYYYTYVILAIRHKISNFPHRAAGSIKEIRAWAASTPIVLDEEVYIPIRGH